MYIQDPGHGGTDSGAVANGLVEKVLTLEAAQYVNKRLNELGVKSTQTRTADTTLSPAKRTSIVKSSGANKCLSHHFNAGGGVGAETIYSIYGNNKLATLILNKLAEKGQVKRRAYTKRGNGGRDFYYMHRDTGKVETIIIEYGFLDSADANELKNKTYRESLYEAIVEAVCINEGVNYHKSGNTPVQKPKSNKPIGKVRITSPDGFLNLRDKPSFQSNVIRKLQNGTEWAVFYEKNGFFNLGGEQYVSANPNFSKFTKY